MLLINAFVLSDADELKVTASKQLINVNHKIPSHQLLNTVVL